MLALALTILLGAGWRVDGVVDGVKVELRDVEGSKFEEIRLTTTSAEPLQALCDAVWAKGVKDGKEGDFKKRELIKETDTDRWTYEQIALPVVSDRDYVVHVQLLKPASSGACEIAFQTEDDPAHPTAPGHVRLKSVRGHWTLVPNEKGTVDITYLIFSDPGGSTPAFLSKGSQRKAAVDFLKTILKRAQAARDAGTP